MSLQQLNRQLVRRTHDIIQGYIQGIDRIDTSDAFTIWKYINSFTENIGKDMAKVSLELISSAVKQGMDPTSLYEKHLIMLERCFQKVMRGINDKLFP